MTKKIHSFLAISVLAFAFVGVTSAAENLHDLIKSENYSAATSRLNMLYSDHQNGRKAENRLIGEVGTAVSVLPKNHKLQLDHFIELNQNSVAGKFTSALYYQWNGLRIRGQKSNQETDQKKLDALRVNLNQSVTLFQSVIKDDPKSYLAHMYNGINYSYISSRKASDREFKAGLAIKPLNYKIWEKYIIYNQPRWGGSYERMDSVVKEMGPAARKNRVLQRLKGLPLIDKAEELIRKGEFVKAEDLVFRALDFGSHRRYGQTVRYLLNRVNASGDKVAGCRITKKTNALYPKNKRFRELAAKCG